MRSRDNDGVVTVLAVALLLALVLWWKSTPPQPRAAIHEYDEFINLKRKLIK